MNRGTKHWQTRLTEWDVIIIRRLYRAGMSLSRLAREYNYTPSGIYDVVNNLTWKHVMERGA